MEFLKLAEERFSVRNFSNKKIEEDKISKILRAAQVAPTAKNNQPQKIYVLKSEEALEKIKGATRCTFNAPLVFLICANKDESWRSPFEAEYESGEMDASIVTCHMMLEAWELGIGSVWVRHFDVAETKKIFNLPDNIVPVCLLPVGYAAEGVEPSERHMKKKEIKDFVEEL